jgi:hypothetical protein
MTCNLCSQSYSNIVKIYQNDKDGYNNEVKLYLHKLKILNLIKLSKKYCVSGEVHDVDENNKCNKCNKNVSEYKYSDKELELMNKNIDAKTYENNLETFKLMKTYLEAKEKEENKIQKLMSKFNKKYEEKTNNKIVLYINEFIEKLIKILGSKIKVENETIYLKDSQFEIDHDYLGNERKQNIFISSHDPKIEIYKNHPHYKCDIIFYKDNAYNMYVFYDMVTLQYLGYSDNRRDFKKSNTNVYLRLHLSIKDYIILLGLENQYVNLYHINS